MSEGIVLENLRRDIQMRNETDKILSTAWIFLPLIGVIMAIVGMVVSAVAGAMFVTPAPGEIPEVPVGGILAFMGVFWAIGIIMLIAYIYLVYNLIRRRNRHFMRQSHFTEDLVDALKSIASKKNVNIELPISSVERTHREMKMEEGEKSAVLWVILLFIPFVNFIASLYILYFLTKDFYKHERREDNILQDFGRTFEAVNLSMMIRRDEPIPERSYIVYLILTIITLGLFGIYWLYTLINDPNNHFRQHIRFEDEILSKLSAPPTPT